MNNPLQTARVVIIDDSEEEAAPLVMTLAKMGLGAWYFTGNAEELPDTPLCGIRVVFLDLRLAGAHTDHDAIPITLAVLERIIGTSAKSTAIVFWSKHPDSIAEFRVRLAKEMPSLNPAFVYQIDSKKDLLKLGHDGQEGIRQHIEKAMSQGPATSVMHEWEQVIHHAASATFDSLTTLAIGDDQQLDQVKLMNLLGALAASVGNDARNLAANRSPAVLFEALGPIHFDQVSHSRSKFAEDDKRAVALKVAIENPQPRTVDQTARINAALLTAPVAEAAASFQPGDVFMHRLALGIKCPHHHCVVKKRDMVKGFEFKADVAIKQMHHELAKAKDGAADELEKKISLREKEIVDGFHSLLVELTPACDFAQGKRATLRFIGGILVPLEHKKLIPKGDYLRQLPLVTLAEPAGNWILVLNSRFLFGISRPDEKVESKPTFRLRSRVLIDIQAWVASQVARPGYDFL